MNPRQLLDELPDDALLPVRMVRALLASLEVDESDSLADLTCEQVAEALGRRPSTVRAWAARGDLGAYKLGREWRVRREDLRAYQDRQRANGTTSPAATSLRGREVDLGAWRKVRRAT